MRNCTRIGFEIIRELGNNGAFYYPKEGLIATAIIVKDIANIPLAKIEEQNRIFHLRDNPEQFTIEKGPKGEMEIQYQTIITL